MGRWSYSNRRTVEHCKDISVFFLKKYDYFCGYRTGGIQWTNYAGEKVGTVGIEVNVDGMAGSIRFQYTNTDIFTNEKTDLDYKAYLVSIPCRYGGKRWYFLCPLNNCGRRVAILYLKGRYFGCRHCHNLTYMSCQDNHSWLAKKMGVTPKMLREVFKHKNNG